MTSCEIHLGKGIKKKGGGKIAEKNVSQNCLFLYSATLKQRTQFFKTEKKSKKQSQRKRDIMHLLSIYLCSH